MADLLTDEDVKSALQDCASEPVHIPGSVQPFGCLIAVEAGTEMITHASDNAEAFTGHAPATMFGRTFGEVFGREVWHAVKNALARHQGQNVNGIVGDFDLGAGPGTLHCFERAGHIIIDVEPQQDAGFSGGEALRTLSFLMKSIEECANEQALFEITVRLMRMLTGYDRAMIYRFDSEWNGEVLAEDRHRVVEPFLGLRFPHWDIPAQARDIMKQVPVRFIVDVDQRPVPLGAKDAAAPPLDITLAHTRGVSAVHMEYLKNMGVAATMTLSLLVDGKLWGILSFHHRRPHVPAPGLREILASFGQIFATKLQVLRQQARLSLVERVDALKDQVLSDLEEGDAFESFAATVCDIMGSDGLQLTLGDRVLSSGIVPDAPLRDHLRDLARTSEGPMMYDNLGRAFPRLSNARNGCAGAFLLSDTPDRSLCVFRRERTRDVAWAGNPEKTLEDRDGRKRLAPRGSFSTYLELVRGEADPWSDQDQYFASRIWSLVNSVERRDLINSLSRQQQIMIDELNHRVRNILALVRSVSAQARRSSYGSIDSYARSLEARIQALAASHDLAAGSMVAAVPVTELIEKEFEPFLSSTDQRYVIKGEGQALRADVAPIFSLVIHELVTNAVKYGALSNETGKVAIDLALEAGGVTVDWRESSGPPVVAPEELGFGSTLIRQAIPHELNGETSLEFHEAGVKARLVLPKENFDLAQLGPVDEPRLPLVQVPSLKDIKARLAKTTCLVLEDNFVIAEGMRSQLMNLGLGGAETVSNVADALDQIAFEPPGFAVLDINLGGGKTSAPVAERLRDLAVPYFFVTGYGEGVGTEDAFAQALRLTKPATDADLLSAIAQVLKIDGSGTQ